MFVDSHCHLNYPGLIEDQAGAIARARASGVAAMVNISTRESEWQDVIATARSNAGIWASIGIHPHEADQHQGVDTAKLLAAIDDPKVIAIGETGLDYYYDKSDREQQRQSFRAHIAAARTSGLPIIVHMRDAEEDAAAILQDEMAKGSFAGVIHCFTSTQDFAIKSLNLGFYISLSGIVTFKSAKSLQEIARGLPIDRLLIETDSPFLAPVPHRGRGCEPAFVSDTAHFLAELRGMTVEELGKRTTENFYRLFGKADPKAQVQ